MPSSKISGGIGTHPLGPGSTKSVFTQQRRQLQSTYQAHRRPNRWHRHRSYGTSSQWAVGIQACLAQLVGPWVPQNGIIGPRTRRAVQIFQGQHQLRVTGLLDSATVAALQSACAGQDAGPAGPVAPPSPVPGPPPAGGPDVAGPPDAGGADNAGEAEFESTELTEADQELRVDGECRVEVAWHDPVPFAKDKAFGWAPEAPAVYVTYVGGKPWHVGIAEHNLRRHLISRARALQNLNIPLSAIQNRAVAWASLRTGVAPRCAIQWRRGTGPASLFQPVYAKHGILRILKQYFVRKFQTSDKGNVSIETVQFSPNGSLEVIANGKPMAKLSAGSAV